MKFTTKILAALFVVCVLVSYGYAQENTQNDANADDQFQDPSADFQQGLSEEQRAAMMEAERAKLWACFYITRIKLYSPNQNIAKYLSGKTGNDYFKRMATDIMKTCLTRMKYDETQKVFAALNKEDFNVDEFDYLHGFKIENYEGESVNLKLETEDIMIWDYYEKLEENIRQQGDEQAEREQKQRRKQMDFEPQIGGFSLKNLSPFAKMVYMSALIGGIAILFLVAYRKLFATEETAYEKLKREKQAKKSSRAKSQ